MSSVARPPTEPVTAVGRVLSGQTHELTNVLSIVIELGGLLDDLAAAQGEAGERLRGLADRLRRQARRGQRMVADLNTVAHTIDAVVAEVDLGDLATLLGGLLERPARQSQIELSVAEAAGAWRGEPLRALHATLAVAESAIARTAPGGRLHVELSVAGDALVLVVSGGPQGATGDGGGMGSQPDLIVPEGETGIRLTDRGGETGRIDLRLEMEPGAKTPAPPEGGSS